MTPRTRRIIPTVFACGTLAVGGAAISGCGASSTIDPVAQAAETTSALPGAQVSITEQVSSASLPAPISLSGTGYVNQQERTAQLTFDFSQIPGLSQLGSGSKQVTMLIDYPDLYMNAPFLSAAFAGKSWVKIDLSSVASSAGLGSLTSSAGNVDPSQFLNYLRASSGGVTTVGTETINGVTTTHYRATIELDKVVSRLPASEQAAATSAIATLEKETGLTSLPIDVWIDAQHRVRRESFTLTIKTAAATSTVAVTIDFLSFGPTPAITPPPSDQVYDLTSKVAGALSSGTTGSQG